MMLAKTYIPTLTLLGMLTVAVFSSGNGDFPEVFYPSDDSVYERYDEWVSSQKIENELLCCCNGHSLQDGTQRLPEIRKEIEKKFTEAKSDHKCSTEEIEFYLEMAKNPILIC